MTFPVSRPPYFRNVPFSAFEGFRWRTAKELDLNFVWAYLYITDAPEGHVSKVWFDDIVVATEYIGPIKR